MRPCRRQRASGSATCWHLDIFVVEQRTIGRAAWAFVGLARDVEAQVGAWAASQKFRTPGAGRSRSGELPACRCSLSAQAGPCAPPILDLFGIDSFNSINCNESYTHDAITQPPHPIPLELGASDPKMSGKGFRGLNEAMRALSLASQPCRNTRPSTVRWPDIINTSSSHGNM